MRKLIFDKGDYLEQKRKQELKKKGEEIRKKCKKRSNKQILYFETKEDVFKHIKLYLKYNYKMEPKEIKHIIDEAMYCVIHITKKEVYDYCNSHISNSTKGIQTDRTNNSTRQAREIAKNNNYCNNYSVQNNQYDDLSPSYLTQEQMDELAEEIINNMHNRQRDELNGGIVEFTNYLRNSRRD